MAKKGKYTWMDLAKLLLVIGGINWLLFAFGYNALNAVFGGFPTIELIVYVLIGLSGLWFAKEWYM